MRLVAATLVLMTGACPLWADIVPDDARRADIVVLGEVHDNPVHHVVQARWVRALQPAALVFEMIGPQQAQLASPQIRTNRSALENALSWADSGWPDFDMYYPIFEAAPDAEVFGAAVPRRDARRLMGETLGELFGDDARRFSLNTALPDDQQSAREDLQAAAHCGALPDDMLPFMVDVQRLRDATLARAALTALESTGGPVVVITGNGHARADWGMPALLNAPGVQVFALGQSEDGAIGGTFDLVVDAPAVDRGDPCAAFRKDG